MIHGRMYHLTNDEINEYLEKEDKMKRSEEQAKRLAMTKSEVIKIVQEELKRLELIQRKSSLQSLSSTREDLSSKVDHLQNNDKRNFDVHNPFKFADFGITKLDELGPVYERLKKILEELGIQSALPAPIHEQALSKSSGRKRKNMELIFFTDVFGDQAFQRWNDIHKVGVNSLDALEPESIERSLSISVDGEYSVIKPVAKMKGMKGQRRSVSITDLELSVVVSYL
ncbi:hypothetical protein Tco_1046951 [Tanacetum coccineum]